jgi:molybdopterin-containing oxidoreductase family iron-sulfur binding subunit
MGNDTGTHNKDLDPGQKRRKMHLWGMAIDLDKCTGCQACVIACKSENNIPFVGPDQAELGRDIRWMEMITETHGEYPKVKTRFIPRPCLQCDDPPCIKVCPVYATYRNPEGIVAQVYARCIGCRFCMAACPYTAKYFTWHHFKIPKVMQRYNPDVFVRPAGVVEKCTFCHHRLQNARDLAASEGREFRTEEYIPACVESCPSKAMYFGDLNDPKSEVAKRAESPRGFRLLEDLGTKPKVIYLSEGEKHDIS